MIPSYVRERLSFLKDFRNELTSVYNWLRYYNELVWPLAPEVLVLYEEFKQVGYALALISYRTEIPFPNRKVTIGEWIARTKQRWEDERKEPRWLAVPASMQPAYVWENKEMDYWSGIPRALDGWWTTGPHRLEGISWAVETPVVKLTMQGKSPTHGLKPVIIAGVERAFWALDSQPDGMDVPARARHTYILAAQFLAQQGNGVLVADVHGDHVSMQLHMPRADTGGAAPESWPFSMEQAGRVVDEMLYLIASGMQQGCQKLEEVMSEEIRQLLPRADETAASDILGKLRQRLDDLQQVEQDLSRWLSDFPYVVEL